MSARQPTLGVVRTPTILQMEALECGAAALAMILAHYGRWAPLEELRVQCGVSRDGSKAINLVKAARSFGLKAQGKRLEPSQLANLPTPAILFVNMNHFVIFEGMTKVGFQINDPGGGRRTVTAAEFDPYRHAANIAPRELSEYWTSPIYELSTNRPLHPPRSINRVPSDSMLLKCRG